MSRRQDSASDDSSDEDRDPSHAQELRENLHFIKEMEFQLKKHNRRRRQIALELVAAQARLEPEDSNENQEGDEADQAQLQSVQKGFGWSQSIFPVFMSCHYHITLEFYQAE